MKGAFTYNISLVFLIIKFNKYDIKVFYKLNISYKVKVAYIIIKNR